MRCNLLQNSLELFTLPLAVNKLFAFFSKLLHLLAVRIGQHLEQFGLVRKEDGIDVASVTFEVADS